MTAGAAPSDKTDRCGWDEAWGHLDLEAELGTLAYGWVQPWLGFIAAHVPRGSRVLEAGCGLGRMLHWLAERGCRPVGVDWSAVSLAAVRRKWPHFLTAAADVRRLPFAEGLFDVCLSFGVVEHFPEGPEACLLEMRRVLAPGGTLVLGVPHRNLLGRIQPPLHAAYRWLRGLRPQAPDEPLGRWCRFSEFRDALQRTGFELVAAEPGGHAYAFHSFSGLFRRRGAHHDVTPLGVALGNLARWVAPWATAPTLTAIARRPAGDADARRP
jgi:SAM-dependent methyltransferase